MKCVKQNIVPIICIIILLVVGFNLKTISKTLANILDSDPKVIVMNGNEYTKKDDFIFVKNSTEFVPYKYNDLLDIIYTSLNNGWETFTFYCPKEYADCLKDLKSITSDSILLTHINNFVHPYNSINGLKIISSETGQVTLNMKYVYTDEQISEINSKVNSLMNELFTDEMEIKDKIRVIHDYIVNNVSYDVLRNDKGDSPYESNIAYGPLFEGYATCDGYSDVMAIFLIELGLKNYRIATIKSTDVAGHVWNAVLINNTWYHLDLTWDDPISNTGVDVLRHKYFLITDEELILADQGEIQITEHDYDKYIYLEFKNS